MYYRIQKQKNFRRLRMYFEVEKVNTKDKRNREKYFPQKICKEFLRDFSAFKSLENQRVVSKWCQTLLEREVR